MSLLSRFIPNLLRSTSLSIGAPTSLIVPATESTSTIFGQAIRTVIRCHFPRPSERKRIKRHGWKTRMSTDSGRRILMRKILKGCFVRSH